MIAQIVIMLMTLFIFTITCGAMPQTPPLCEPGVFEEMPARIKKVCLALENSNQLNSALNAYMKNEESAYLYSIDQLNHPSNNKVQRVYRENPAGGNQLDNQAEKRTDVDHVFLRFGR